MTEFSFYTGGIKNKIPSKSIDITEFVTLIKSDKYTKRIEQIRELNIQDAKLRKEQQNLLKSYLDYVTPAGIFKERNKTGLQTMSGYAPIDIDDVQNIQELIEKLKADQYVCVLFRSPTGNGIKVFIKTPLDANKYEGFVVSFYGYLAIKYHISHDALDSATKDISRACYVSHDPGCYFNPDAKIYDISNEKEVPVEQEIAKNKIDTSRSGQEFGELCRRIKGQLKKGEDHLDKEEIFAAMTKYSKWKDAGEAYREHTWKNALQKVQKKIEEEQLRTQKQSIESENVIPENLEAMQQAETILKNEELLFKIHDEISKKHLSDDKIKMALFIVACTAYLDPAEYHKSMALKGSRSVGKDNLYKSVLRLFPDEDYIILTNATQATLEDDIHNYKIIAHSEINLQRDDKGANAHLVEVIKQLTEGGIASMKKNINTGFKTTTISKQLQKTVIYGTAEVGNDDDELQTRFIVGAVDADAEKINLVNTNSLRIAAGLIPEDEKTEWFACGIRKLLSSSHVIIPFAVDLPKDFFDNSDARAMRDAKRFLACAAAITWLHQLQRKKDEKGRVIAELYDFLAAMILTSDFFNYTYKGLGDQRLQNFMNCVDKHLSETKSTNNTFYRNDIQEEMGISINTVKELCKACQNLSMIRYHSKEGNKIMYERCQKGVKKLFIGVNWKEVYDYFENKKGIKIQENIANLLYKLQKTVEKQENPQQHSIQEKIDTFLLTPSIKYIDNPLLTNPPNLDFISKQPLMIEVVQTKLQEQGLSMEKAEEIIKIAKERGDIFEQPSGYLQRL